MKRALKPGQLVRGVVQKISDHGAVVDIHGVSGFLHISEISDRWLKHPSEELKVGDSLTLRVISNEIDEKGRVWVATLDRQLTMEERYAMSKIPTKKGIVESPEMINAYKLEIFDTDGVLLGEIPLNHRVHGIRIFKHYLFVWERNYTKYYQYEIVEK